MAGPLILTHTTEKQLRLRYDATNYADFTTGSTGDLTIAPTGADTAVTGRMSISSTLTVTGAFTASSTAAITGAATLSSSIDVTGTIRGRSTTRLDGNVGIGAAAGGTRLLVSDPAAASPSWAADINFSALNRRMRLGIHSDNPAIQAYLGDATTVNALLLNPAGGGLMIGATTGTGLVSNSVMIGNVSAAPSTNPVGGGILYVEAGSLRFRGSSGTVTTIAAA
jgi:hypothetical protein